MQAMYTLFTQQLFLTLKVGNMFAVGDEMDHRGAFDYEAAVLGGNPAPFQPI
jgi:hypothetical protein